MQTETSESVSAIKVCRCENQVWEICWNFNAVKLKFHSAIHRFSTGVQGCN